MTEYKFDQPAVITYTVTTRQGPKAARIATQALDTIADGGQFGWETNRDVAKDVTYDVRCIAMRGAAVLVDTDPDQPIPHEDLGTVIAVSPELVAQAQEALARLERAADSDSPEDEHEAGHDCAELLARVLLLAGQLWTTESAAKLASLETVFDAAGGRGVELAEDIDTLRARRAWAQRHGQKRES